MPFGLQNWLLIRCSVFAFQVSYFPYGSLALPPMTADLFLFFPWIYCPSSPCCLLLEARVFISTGEQKREKAIQWSCKYVGGLQAPELLITPHLCIWSTLIHQIVLCLGNWGVWKTEIASIYKGEVIFPRLHGSSMAKQAHFYFCYSLYSYNL